MDLVLSGGKKIYWPDFRLKTAFLAPCGTIFGRIQKLSREWIRKFIESSREGYKKLLASLEVGYA